MKNLDLAHMKTSGLHLIEASAGTGKTWTIAALYILLLLESRLRPEEILVVTYTKAATAELRDRVRTRINSALDLLLTGRPARDNLEQMLLETRTTDRDSAVKLLTRALYSFDDAAIYTIHGFCQRALLENAFESGSLFDTEMITDQSALVDEVCRDFWRSNILAEPAEFLEKLIAAGYTPEKLAKPFKGHYQDPGLTVIPPAGDPDLGALAARRDALFNALEAHWQSDRNAITAELAVARLNQNSYSPVQISKASENFTQWINGQRSGQHCEKLEFFSINKIESRKTAATTLPSHPFFELCRQMHDIFVESEQAFKEKLINRQTGLHSWIKKELASRKRSRNLRCYDDLLLDLHTALASDRGGNLAVSLRTRYRAALIDEFQDTDPIQWQIFRNICSVAEYPLYLIGDPKQAIYSFRGADIFAYIAAARAVNDDRQSTLDTNRRSVAPLVAAVNTLFAAVGDPFLCRDITFKPVNSGRDPEHGLFRGGKALEHPLQFWVYPREDQSAAVKKGEANRGIVCCVAEEVARLLDGSIEIIDRKGRRALAAGDIAVLVKAHYQADLLQEALGNLGIPSVQHGSSTIFESVEALDLLRILRAANEPSRERLVREALLTGTLGIPADQLAGYLGEAADDRDWEEWLIRFRSLQDAARTGGVITLAERLLSQCGVRRRALGRAGGERLLTNIMHCVELLHQAEQGLGLGLEGLITWLERCIARKDEDETVLLRLETDANAVQLSTIHASKGLEYPVVFLPFAWDAPSSRNDQLLFHDDSGALTLDLGSAQSAANKARADGERAAEAARLLYVAITRAEFLCYAAWGCINGAQSSPLFPLLHGRTVSDPKAFRNRTDQDILADIRNLAGPAGGLAAALMPVDTPFPPYRPMQDHVKPFTCRSLPRAISNEWRVSSFSSLTSGSERSLQPQDYDSLALPATDRTSEPPAPRPDAFSIHDFPRGTSAGTCLHEILERLDYSALTAEHTRQFCSTRLRANGYPESWQTAITGMVTAVTRAALIGDAPHFSLSQLHKGSWQTEMEFFLPVAQLSPERLRGVFDGFLQTSQHGDFGATLDSLSFQQSRGMLQGFMDLVFEHAGRYYIVDWKSNHLGFGDSDYTHDNMTRAMADHAYILQYHLYALALHRHLKQRIAGYAYETHFGGAIYVFLRGLNRDDPQRGIYRDTPPVAFIERAEKLLLG